MGGGGLGKGRGELGRVGGPEPSVTASTRRRNRPATHTGRQIESDIGNRNRRDHECFPREASVQKVNQAIWQYHLPADVGTSDEQECLVPFSHHFAFNDRRKMSVAPIIHVLVRRTGDGVPVYRRIAEQNSNAPGGRNRLIESTNVGEEVFIDRRRPYAADLRGVLPYLLEFLATDRLACDVAVDHPLVTRVSELNNYIGHLAREPGMANQRANEVLRFQIGS